MPRKPNYDFERREREKARALKKEERQRLKREKSQQRKGDAPETATEGTTESGAGAPARQPAESETM